MSTTRWSLVFGKSSKGYEKTAKRKIYFKIPGSLPAILKNGRMGGGISHDLLARHRVTRWGEFWPIWRLFTLGSFCENYTNSTNNRAIFSTVDAPIFTKLGYILGDFLTNASGHPSAGKTVDNMMPAKEWR
jgi:hypothetical protein